MILDSLKIPVLKPQRVPIKTLLEQLQPTADNKKLITERVNKIELVSLLNNQTIHIRPYKDDEYSYQAIYVLQIVLKGRDKLTELSGQLHSAFPEPTILIYQFGDTEWISVAPKRLNKLDENKSVIEDVVVQEIKNETTQYLNLSTLSAVNLREYYLSVVDRIYRIGVYSLTGLFPRNNIDCKYFIKEYQRINASINSLKEQYKKASMKSEKMEVDDELYDEEQNLKKLMRSIKGEITNG